MTPKKNRASNERNPKNDWNCIVALVKSGQISQLSHTQLSDRRMNVAKMSVRKL